MLYYYYVTCILCYVILYYIIFYYITLHYSILYYIILYYVIRRLFIIYVMCICAGLPALQFRPNQHV